MHITPVSPPHLYGGLGSSRLSCDPCTTNSANNFTCVTSSLLHGSSTGRPTGKKRQGGAPLGLLLPGGKAPRPPGTVGLPSGWFAVFAALRPLSLACLVEERKQSRERERRGGGVPEISAESYCPQDRRGVKRTWQEHPHQQHHVVFDGDVAQS